MAGKSTYVQVGAAGHSDDDGAPTYSNTPNQHNTNRKTRPSASFFDDGWATEIICALLGTVLIVALVLVLHEFHGKPAPSFGSAFGSALTLNIVVAIISAAAKAALLLPVAECVSQFKWLWYAGGYRRLSEMSTFDKASRGILGGFELLLKTRFQTFASVGAVLLIVGIAIDPLSQQLISYAEQSRPSDGLNATVGILKEWNDGSAQDGVSIIGTFNREKDDPTMYGGISIGMKGAILQGLYNSNETILDLSPDCSGNCTFQPYTSLAVCTSFADVSSNIVGKNFTEANGTFDDMDYRYYVSTHQYLRQVAYQDAYMNVSSAAPLYQVADSDGMVPLSFSDSVAFKDVNTSIADVFMIVLNGTGDGNTYIAIEFTLEWCIQNYSTVVTNGTAVTQRHNAFRDFVSDGGSYYPTAEPFGAEGLQYTVFPETHYSLQRYFQNLFKGTVIEDGGLDFYASSDAAQALFQPFDFAQTYITNQTWSLEQGIRGTNETGLELTINNVATSMTNYIRRQIYAYGKQSGVVNPYVPWANGTVYHQVTVVAIRWKWIAAHVVFTALSLLFLLVTILCQAMSPLKGAAWKSSSLAVLHALHPGLQQELSGVTRQSHLDLRDGEKRVRLLRTSDDGWRLLGESKEEMEMENIR